MKPRVVAVVFGGIEAQTAQFEDGFEGEFGFSVDISAEEVVEMEGAVLE